MATWAQQISEPPAVTLSRGGDPGSTIWGEVDVRLSPLFSRRLVRIKWNLRMCPLIKLNRRGQLKSTFILPMRRLSGDLKGDLMWF